MIYKFISFILSILLIYLLSIFYYIVSYLLLYIIYILYIIIYIYYILLYMYIYFLIWNFYNAFVDAKFCPGYCIFILGLGPICDKFRIWASNLVICFFYLSSLWVILVLVILFRICFTFRCHLSLNVMFVFVSYRVLFIHIYSCRMSLFFYLIICRI